MPRIAMEAIIPKHIFRLPLVRAELLQEMGRQLDIIDRMYGATYRTWNHKPQFKKKFRSTRSKIVGEVTTIDVIYFWADDGTRRHVILPRRNNPLAFPASFRPKTRPKTIGSGSGFRGGGTVFSERVVHPGQKPRNFTKTIVDRRLKFYAPQMQRAVARGVKRRA